MSAMIHIDHYQFNRGSLPIKWRTVVFKGLLGSGGFGNVYEIEHDGESFAIKIQRSTQVSTEECQLLRMHGHKWHYQYFDSFDVEGILHLYGEDVQTTLNLLITNKFEMSLETLRQKDRDLYKRWKSELFDQLKDQLAYFYLVIGRHYYPYELKRRHFMVNFDTQKHPTVHLIDLGSGLGIGFCENHCFEEIVKRYEMTKDLTVKGAFQKINVDVQGDIIKYLSLFVH